MRVGACPSVGLLVLHTIHKEWKRMRCITTKDNRPRGTWRCTHPVANCCYCCCCCCETTPSVRARARTTDDERRDARSAGVADWNTSPKGIRSVRSAPLRRAPSRAFLLSPRPCKAAAPKGPAFCFFNYYRSRMKGRYREMTGVSFWLIASAFLRVAGCLWPCPALSMK